MHRPHSLVANQKHVFSAPKFPIVPSISPTFPISPPFSLIFPWELHQCTPTIALLPIKTMFFWPL